MADKVKVAGTYLNDVTLPSWDRLGLRPVCMAYDGQIGAGSVLVRETGSYSKYSGRRITCEVGGSTAMDGFIGEQLQTRPSDDALYRLNTYSWQDNNLLLAHRRVSSWSRPAETDRARVLAAMAAFCPALDTSTYVPNTNTVNLPKKKYTDTDLVSILADCMDQSAKTFFADRGRKFHYHLLEEDVSFNASIQIDDGAAPGSTTHFAPEDPEKIGDPSDLSNDIRVVGSDGSTHVTVTDATSITRHNADDLAFEDTLTFPDSNNSTDLTNYGNAILSTRKENQDSWSCTLAYLPDPTVIDAGMRILVTSSIMGLSATYKRIASITWETTAPNVWIAHLELGSPKRAPWELRHRRKQNTPGTTNPSISDGAAVTLSRYQLAQEAGSGMFGPASGLWDSISPSFAFGTISAAVNGIVERDPQGNISWPYTDCGVGTGGVAGLTTRAVWHRFTIDLSAGDIAGVLVTVAPFLSSGSGYTTSPGGFLVGDGTVTVGMHTGANSSGSEVTDSEDYVAVGTVGDQGGEVFIPSSLLIDVTDGYCWIVLTPNWTMSSDLFFCNSAGNKPWGYGNTGHDSNGSSIVSAIKRVVSGTGLSPWLSGVGDVDGTNATFNLPLWNGKGTPEVRVGNAILDAGEFTFDTSTGDVTLNTPPPADMAGQVFFRFQMGD